ncbi:MAG: hypothetical protein H6709_21620 [Kofleriaceae bacterium]|nr:hypothetical protein [Myxococcales bacterium]MCB9564337.1 hypothetical protein [Kofleriaceae bacterium]MCB9574685.1 hypothetical protein [Kofleriaceae bacterium]
MSALDDVRLADDIEVAAWRDLAAASPPVLRIEVADVADGAAVRCGVAPITMFNRVIGLGTRRAITYGELAAVISHYRAAGVPSCWVHVGPATDAGLRARLTAAGFAPARRARWAKMLLRPDDPRPDVITSALTVREIAPDDHAHGQAVASLLTAVFAMPPAAEPWLLSLLGRPGWRVYAAFDGPLVVGGGCCYVRGEWAWLGLAGIGADHRRRGGQRALLWRRIDDALAAGCTAVGTETGEPIHDEPNPSLVNMQRCGLRLVCSRENLQLDLSP